MTKDTQVQAWFNKKVIPREKVLAWEAKRSVKALHKLGVPVPAGNARVLRKAVTDAKVELGREAIETAFAREVKVTDMLTGALARLSGKHRRVSQVELFAPGATAHQLLDWYTAKAVADDEAAFLDACPDHHLFRPIEEPRGQEVWETTGGSPIAARFFFELDVTDGVVTPADPTYPVQMVGIARIANGTVIGGIRHQFRDETSGARTILTVEFPWLIGPFGPAAHRWHLASEFSNWLEASGQA